jgi:hypothetical protein
LQKGGVRWRDVIRGSGCCGIRWINGSHHVQQTRSVLDGTGHRTRRVAPAVEWCHPCATHQSHGWSDAHQVVDRRRRTHAAASVGANPHHPEIGGNCYGGATGGATAGISRVVRVTREARKHRIDVVGEAHRQLGEGSFCEQNCASVAQALHDERVALRNEILQDAESGGSRHVHSVQVVFDDHRHAVEWSGERATSP